MKVSQIESRATDESLSLRVGEVGNSLVWDTRVLRAGAASSSGLALLLRGVDGVEPEHVGVVLFTVSLSSRAKPVSAQGHRTYVVPDGHDQNHGNADGVLHRGPSADLSVAVALVENAKLVGAEVVGDLGRIGDTVKGWGRRVDADAVLDEVLVETVVVELGDNAGKSCQKLGFANGNCRSYVNTLLVSTVRPAP